ncbi:short-chain dehydrogenase [Coniochaeta ligniaria NRRL 30616]|uniref:Short-chain dehydrogenase n=1 Tax=Coniochaeta ligniaria NRRL 30616 TaxID=1408157 RepID=A0A1J7IY81_9PEZI|nr:short-chain dehydrogenase [Coniochaeta ligniaria NRRL 30616]
MPSSIDLPPLQELYIRRWIRGQFTKPIPPAKDLDLSGQTGILVGGTDGIGLACARVLLDLKLSTLILGARNMEKGNAVAKTLTERSESSNVQVWELEMLSYDSIQDFAKRCATLERIDFVILGASVLPSDFRLNPSTGHELTIQVHYWSTALLSLLLLPVLKEKHVHGKPAHLTIISSDLAHVAEFKEGASDPLLPAFDEPVSWSPSMATERYNSCKVLVMMLVLKLKDVVDPSDVVVNCVCPGMSKPTANEREQPWVFRSITRLIRNVLGRPLEACAWVYVNAAVEQGAESHGSYLASWQISPFPKLMYTEEGKLLTGRVWTETLEAFKFAGVKDLLSSISARKSAQQPTVKV